MAGLAVPAARPTAAVRSLHRAVLLLVATAVLAGGLVLALTGRPSGRCSSC